MASSANDDAPDRSDTDSISVTSTLEENEASDEEWPVEQVLAEGMVDGELRYLIEWSGYELSDASWEPKKNLTASLLEEWERTKFDRAEGTASAVKISDWKKATLDNLRGRISRHDARNRKRAKQGLPQTVYDDSLEDMAEHLKGFPDDPEDSQPVIGKSVTPSKNVTTSATVVDNPQREKSRKSSPRHHDSNGQPSPPIWQTNARPTSSVRSVSGVSSPKVQPSPMSPQISKLSAQAKTSLLKKISPAPRKTLVTPGAATQVRKLSAIHSGHGDQSTNVFAGGKQWKQSERSLLKAASDTTRKPRLLNARGRRQLEKASRDKEGTVAPALLPNTLFSLDKRASLDAGIQANDSEVTMEHSVDDPATNPLTVTVSSAPMEFSSVQKQNDEHPSQAIPEAGVGKRKRRVVHWADDPLSQEPVDLQSDESLFVQQAVVSQAASVVGEGSAVSITTHVTEESCKSTGLTLEQNPSAIIPEGISKLCQIGLKESQSIVLTFHDTSGYPQSSWVHKFNDLSRLVFTHTCTAQNFSQQNGSGMGQFRASHLSSGYISSTASEEKLTTISDRLKIGSLGFLYHGEEFCILVMPSKCEEWQFEYANCTIKAESALQYSIFQPSDLFKKPPLGGLGSLVPYNGEPATPSPLVFKQFFETALEKLIPLDAQEMKKPSFFLAFPPSAQDEAALISRWLRKLDPGCDIKTSLHVGHWLSFVKSSQGVVILHEDAICAIRQFRSFADLLHSSNARFNFWIFTRALNFHHAQSLGIGDICLTPAFTSGMAMLLTPSFIVSQPEQAYNFVKWFWQNYSRASDTFRQGIMVVCASVEEWALNLALETDAKHRECSKTASIAKQKEQGIDSDAVIARMKTWKMLRLLAIDSNGDVDGPLFFAPECIDGNDEQSLVNWFGYWTLSEMRHFRKLLVVGSSERNPSRLSRIVQQPGYEESSINVPDAVYERLVNTDSLDTGKSVLQSTATSMYQLVPRDDASSLRTYLGGVEKRLRKTSWCPLFIYRIPLAYWNTDMAFHFGDIKSGFQSYDAWFRFCWPLLLQNQHRATGQVNAFHNTFAGVFYTIQGCWDRENRSATDSSLPRSWVAFLRPMELHRRPWTATELIIWDHTLLESISNDRKVYEEDLIEAQQQLITLVRRQTRETPTGLPLKRVWIGGFQISQGSYSQPLDITLKWLSDLTDDIRNCIPSSTKHMPEKGWLYLTPGGRDRSVPKASLDLMDLDVPAVNQDNGNDALRKVIFHPPPGKPGSRCRNRLFQAANESRSRGLMKDFEFKFRPTMEWYGEQVEEGRGFEHVKVATWETIFARHKIDDPKRAQGEDAH